MRGRRGFTLIEVVVAVAVLGIAVVAVLQLFSGTLRGIKASEDRTELISVARARMREALAMEDIEEGLWQDYRGQYTFSFDVAERKLREEELPVKLLDISMTVRKGDGPSYEFGTFKAVRGK